MRNTSALSPAFAPDDKCVHGVISFEFLMVIALSVTILFCKLVGEGRGRAIICLVPGHPDSSRRNGNRLQKL